MSLVGPRDVAACQPSRIPFGRSLPSMRQAQVLGTSFFAGNSRKINSFKNVFKSNSLAGTVLEEYILAQMLQKIGMKLTLLRWPTGASCIRQGHWRHQNTIPAQSSWVILTMCHAFLQQQLYFFTSFSPKPWLCLGSRRGLTVPSGVKRSQTPLPGNEEMPLIYRTCLDPCQESKYPNPEHPRISAAIQKQATIQAN